MARAFLRWLDEHEARHPNPHDYLDVEPLVDNLPVTEQELERAVLRVESYGLIKGLKAMGSRIPLRVHLLDPGRECIDDYDADPARFRQAQGGPGDQHVTIHQGDYGQAAAFAGRDVVQTMNVTEDPDRLRDVARASREVLPLVPEQYRTDIERAVEDAEDAVGSPRPRLTVKQAAAALAAALAASASLLVVLRFIIDALSGGLGGHQ
ncbi:hypothetical protein [Actinomycetospora sp. NBRC 106378]|uniref:hypothetical protein n=1 Tax=Actinomycetospora sp. NBRC 106378 TaxID=3032208 RepID=UPI0024A01D06|nr:hypothetical protein [Actinomycetospora sp. NBRC 106378]GLZ55005.1 hypothetical protein Acsp07_46220 [Actinomycetospora sp. NBRC 106378]